MFAPPVGSSCTTTRNRKLQAILGVLPMILPVLVGAQNPSPLEMPSERPLTGRSQPTYPIDPEVRTTLDETVFPTPLPSPATPLVPQQVADYSMYGYGLWDWDTTGFPYMKLDPTMRTNTFEASVRDRQATTLVSFFTISDVHITDKESPTQLLYLSKNYPQPLTPAPNPLPSGNSSCYSPVMLSTTHVLDAAVQTINALHQKVPFDCGIALGDAANSTQYNELRWYIDVLDGKWITPSSGNHLGATTIGYQKPYQAAGLNKSIPWYQAIGNHDQFWLGSSKVTPFLRKTYVGSDILNIGAFPSGSPDFNTILNTRGFYMGVINGLTEFGEIIDDGATASIVPPPRIAADSKRRSLMMKQWMGEFRKTSSKPIGHGFREKMISESFASYHFYPRADIPIKVIVLDDTDKVACGATAALDTKRYNWLVRELNEGEAKGELMVICAHIPLRPYATPVSPPPPPIYPWWSLFSAQSPVTEDALLAKLHTYKNLILWISGHAHRNTITPQPAPGGDPEYGFWEVETPSLRDFPQQFRRFEITRNSDETLSIFALDVDTAIAAPPTGQTGTPAWNSRSYAIAAAQIFGNPVCEGPNVDPQTGVYNAELVKSLSSTMRAKIALISPIVSSRKISIKSCGPTGVTFTLNNTITGSTPTHYMISESSNFNAAEWLPYSQTPVITVSGLNTRKILYFKVKDGSGKQSAVVRERLPFILGRIFH